jgi:trehalose synthase
MSKFEQVDVPGKMRVADYDRFGKGTARELARLAKPLRDTRVIHLNAAPLGGGVAELLQSQILFERALGLKSRWYAIQQAPAGFFRATKQIHNLLQGKAGVLRDDEKNIYIEVNRELGKSLARIAASFRPDLVVVHDPQPLPAVIALRGKVPVISRLHIDLLTPNPLILEFLRPFFSEADRVVVSSNEYAANMPWIPKRRKSVIFPAIDPLSEKNQDISLEAAHEVLRDLGVNVSQPIVSQVSRFDPWKDPVGAVNAYYFAKNKVPDLQLILAGLFLAADDPEATDIFRHVKKYAKGDPDIFLFTDPGKLADVSADIFVSSVYAASDVVIQKSIREGFGLTMTEAMWKGKPLVAGRTTGALAQVKSGKTGILISSPKQAGQAIARLLKDEKMRTRLGRAAHESVRKKFLMPRYIGKHLRLYRSLIDI